MSSEAGLPKSLRLASFGVILAFQSTKAYRRLAARFCPAYEIVEASPEDLALVGRWWNPGADARPAGPRQGVTDYVARANGTLLGFGQVYLLSGQGALYDGWWLCSLYVRLRYRGMGIGAALTRRRIEHVVRCGGRQVSLEVRRNNAPEIELCRRMGFTEAHLPQPATLLGQGARPTIVMTKKL
jgi:ribosomal protein S18 acetylase RimI-like enzyme